MLRAIIVAASISTVATYGLSRANTIDSVLGNALYWDGRHVKVTGNISNLEERTTLSGRNYDVFSLCDRVCVRVFVDGRPKLADGQKFTVEGTFSAAKRIDNIELPNDIQADVE
jgi:hypothetical protein